MTGNVSAALRIFGLLALFGIGGMSGAFAQQPAMSACPQLRQPESISVHVGRFAEQLASDAGGLLSPDLQQEVVRLGNDFSRHAETDDPGTSGQVAKDITFLDGQLAQIREQPPFRIASEQRVRLRLTMSKLFLRFGCRSEAANLLEGSLVLTADGSLARAQLLTNLGVMLVELDQLGGASEKLQDALKIVPVSKDYATAKTRLGILSGMARLARKAGKRQRALDYYRQVLTELADEKVRAAFESAPDEYDSIEVYTAVNRAILLGYDQKPEEAAPLLEEAYKKLSGHPRGMALGLADVLIAWSDNLLDRGKTGDAVMRLKEAIDLMHARGGRAELLARALQKQAEITSDRSPDEASRSLDELDATPGFRPTPLERSRALSTKAQTLDKKEDYRQALPLYEQALSAMREALPEASLDIATALSNLAFARGHVGDIAGALVEARRADTALNAWLSEEAAGCRAGSAANPAIVALIRETRGLFAALTRNKLRQDGKASEEALREIDRDIFDLVQERERDRVGVAVRRSAMRRVPDEKLDAYQRAQFELCEARDAFDDAVQSGQRDLRSFVERLDLARKEFATRAGSLGQTVRQQFESGTLKLALEDLPSLLTDQEALIAFRVGEQFSLVFIAVRRGDDVQFATVFAKTAQRTPIEQSVTELISAARGDNAKRELPIATEKLGSVLQLGELKQLFDGVTHTFVVADGALQRLPAHLLPIGAQALGEFSSTSALSSISMLAALREPQPVQPPVRSSAGFGAPVLDNKGCPKPDTSAQRELVQCQGPAYGTEKLLDAAYSIFGGSPPLKGQAATPTALRQADLKQAGLLVLATHGLVGGAPVSQLPAIVLTPETTEKTDTGLFTTDDIADLDLRNVWLAVIAACETASSAPDSVEEGLSGLGLAFARAGARALIVSYWKAEPSATQVLLERTLRLIAERPDLSLSGALSIAMQELRKKAYTPEQWAPFVIIGDGAARPFDR